jgi:hypothetical protein
MAQSFYLMDMLQHCVLSRCDISGGKFLLTTEIHILVEHVTCPVSLFVELYSRALDFQGCTAC